MLFALQVKPLDFNDKVLSCEDGMLTPLVRGAGNDNIWGDTITDFVRNDWSVERQIEEQNGVTYYKTPFTGVNTKTAAGADDLIFGGSGDDWLMGDGGDDFIDVGIDNDVAFGGQIMASCTRPAHLSLLEFASKNTSEARFKWRSSTPMPEKQIFKPVSKTAPPRLFIHADSIGYSHDIHTSLWFAANQSEWEVAA